MSKTLIRQIDKHIELYKDEQNGLAQIEDGTTGIEHSCHPHIDGTGSVSGMKKLGYWDKQDRIVRSHGFIYNIDKFVIDKENSLDIIAAKECRCEACMENASKQSV